jgi:hypothetical protein
VTKGVRSDGSALRHMSGRACVRPGWAELVEFYICCVVDPFF